jgi:hypothetical protein
MKSGDSEMKRHLHHLKIFIVLLLGVLLSCSGRKSPNEPDNPAFSVTNSSPANNATNVTAGSPTTIRVTFSAAVDTMVLGFLIAPVPTSFDRVITLSSDGKTAIVGALLQANTAYTAVIYTAKDKSGNALTTPFQFTFTTGNSFPAGKVQGISRTRSGGQAISPVGTLVGLLKIDLPRVFALILTGQDPLDVLRNNLAALTVVTDETGAYSINNVLAGTYWPAAVKDVDGNARLQPAPLGADALGFYDDPITNNDSVGREDSVLVAEGQTVTNIDIKFP